MFFAVFYEATAPRPAPFPWTLSVETERPQDFYYTTSNHFNTMGMAPLPLSFYARNTLQVAQELLGKVLAHKIKSQWIAGRIVETEAYLGEEDPGSHAFRGPTPRACIMFEKPGKAYIYFVYGNHHCFNVVAHNGGAGAVLIRALEPLMGIPEMKRRRKLDHEENLTNGPGKLAQALGITREQLGVNLNQGNLLIIENLPPEEKITKTPRIGLSQGKRKPYRFCLKKNRHVSKPHPW